MENLKWLRIGKDMAFEELAKGFFSEGRTSVRVGMKYKLIKGICSDKFVEEFVEEIEMKGERHIRAG